MRIVDTNRTQSVSAGSSARRTSGGSVFSLDLAGPNREAARSSAAQAMPSLQNMLTLQAVEDPMSRRRRAARRGTRLLDVLDDLKLRLLEGEIGNVKALDSLLKDAGEPSGDAGLDLILGEIELRAAVELAKRSRKTA